MTTKVVWCLRRVSRSPWTFWVFTLYLLARGIDRLEHGYSFWNLLFLIGTAAICLVMFIPLAARVVRDK